MSNKLDDLVYGWFQVNSFSKEEGKDKHITLSPKARIEEQKPWQFIYSWLDNTKGRRKFNNEIKKLKQSGFLKETIYMKGIIEIECYELTYQYDEMYYLIPVNILEYLIHKQSMNTIRIYCYLMFKYQKNPRYIFTQKEIIKNVFNQKSTTHAELNAMIADTLYELEDEGFIEVNHEKYISLNGKAARVKQIVKVNEQPKNMEIYFKDKSEKALIFYPKTKMDNLNRFG